MAQMPIQSLSGRADPYSAESPATFSGPPKAAIPRGSYLHDPGGISGGILRPGSIDQELFKAHLAAARKEALLAPQPLAKAPSFSGIPKLSPAQLAALGAVEKPAGDLVIDIPAPNPVDPGQGGGRPAPALPGQAGGAPSGTSGDTGTRASPLFPAAPVAPAVPANDAAAPEAGAAPSATIAPPAPATPQSTAPSAWSSAERGPIPGSRRGADGAWELTRLPDKDERDMLRGQKWRVVESEASRKLFLGPDGEFGWDDFVDLINPLQHIPLVNIAYRAITGDEIYGVARMVDVAFGPLAGASTAIDLAFLDMTGESMASNAVAALFGPKETGEAGDIATINTASGASQLADGGLIRRGSNR